MNKPPSTTHVLSADIKVVRTLRPAPNCIGELLSLPTLKNQLRNNKLRAGVVASVTAACEFLSLSANEFPPAQFSSERAFQDFFATKEYRSYISLPQYDLACVDGNVTGISVTGTTTSSPGYTKVSNVVQKPTYNLADVPSTNPVFSGDFASPEPVLIKTGDNRSVDIAVRIAGRISNVERTQQYGVLGFDAPYVWTVLHQKLSCDGTRQATVTYSDFPGISVYADRKLINRDVQSTELARFSRDGGRILTPAGLGRFDPICRFYAVAAPGYTVPPVPARPLRADCEQGKRTGFILPKKDYAVSLYVGSGLSSKGNITATHENPGSSSSLLIAPATSSGVAQVGETFRVVDVVAEQPVGADGPTLSGTTDGLSPMFVDDLLDIVVTHPDGSTASLTSNFSPGCAPPTPTVVKLDGLLAPGTNQIHFEFRDTCGIAEGNSDVYLAGYGIYLFSV